MSITILDSDSSDSDIFIVKQIKPVNKLTLQQALIIKHGVLHQGKSNQEPCHSKEKKKKKSFGESDKRKNSKRKKNTSPSQESNVKNSDDCLKRKNSSGSLQNFFTTKTDEKEPTESSGEIQTNFVEILEIDEEITPESFNERETKEEINKRKNDDENIRLSREMLKSVKKCKKITSPSQENNVKNSDDCLKRKNSSGSLQNFFTTKTDEKEPTESSDEIQTNFVEILEIDEEITPESFNERETKEEIIKRKNDDENIRLSPEMLKSVKKCKKITSLSQESNVKNFNDCLKRKNSSGSLQNFFTTKTDEKEPTESSGEIQTNFVEILEIDEETTPESFNERETKEEINKRKNDDENIRLSREMLKSVKKCKLSNENSPNKDKSSPSPTKTNNTAVQNLLDDLKTEIKIEVDESQTQNDDCVSNMCSSNLSSVIKSCTDLDKEKWTNNSELLCFCLKEIIRDEMRKQLELQESAFEDGQLTEKLISEKECEILEKFLNLEENACKLYVRLLSRKKHWHRVSEISYKDININLNEEFVLLSKANFVDINVYDEDLSTQLNLLSKLELQLLCKTFNVHLKANTSYKKNDLISILISNTKNQKSVLDMLQMKGKVSRKDLLKKEILNYLGMCARLNEGVWSTFNKIMLLFSFPHYFDEENKRFSSQLYNCLRVHKNFVRYPQYKLSPTIVFQTYFDFEQYRKSLQLQEIFEEAINMKSHEDFEIVKDKAKEEFNKLLLDVEYIKRFSNLKSFLQKFSAGSVYARILTKYCITFKKKSNTKEVINIIQLLLAQEYFLKGKRGKWCEILAQAYENIKESNFAAKVLIKVLQENQIDEVQKVTLQLRSQALLKKKTHRVDDSNLREILDDLCTISIQEPPSIEIKGKAVKGNERGSKCVYIEESCTGKMYTSVEERAILHYKSIGFTKGFHTEGFIIHSLYFLIFFDIIYGLSPPGVFQSLYQDAPLDFNSKYFYIHRKDLIDSRLNEICNWSDEEMEIKLKTVYYENFNTQCVISWSEDFTPDLLLEFIKCLTRPIFALICQRLVQNFRVFRSGFPDLTLWNPETKKCKFVEVKSPNDRLSPNQRVWLDFLRNIGVDCEVCNVKNVGFKTCS